MKKLLIIFLLRLCVCFPLNAQNDSLSVESSLGLSTVKSSGTIIRKGNRLFIDGIRLSEEESSVLLSDINGRDFNKMWDLYKTRKTVGIILIPVSVSLMASACLSYGLTVNAFIIPDLAISASILSLEVCAVGGIVAFAAGLGNWIYGGTGMSRIVRAYNNGNKTSLSLGMTNTGNIGLTLTF